MNDDYETLQQFVRAHVGAEIKRRRKRAKLTADQLATAVGVGIGQVFRWEAGANELSYDGLAKVADELSCQVGDLFPPTTKIHRFRKTLAA